MAASSSGRSNWPAWLLAGLVLTGFFYSPLTQVMDASLDASNYASYAYFTAHHFHYGRDVVPMYGPLGFVLPSTAYAGELFWARLAGQLFASAGLSALLLWFFHRSQASAWRWLWLALVVVLAPYIEDLPFELALLLGGLCLLECAAPLAIAGIVALLAFISLIKGTHLILAGGTIALVVLFHASQRRWTRAAGILAAFAAAWLLAWRLAGQPLAGAPDFLRGVAALVRGYNDAMALAEPAGVLARGLLALALLAGGLAWGLWRARRQPALLAAGVLLAAYGFALWKHGFVRADGHVVIFHHFAAIAAGLSFLLLETGPVRAEPVGLRGAPRAWLVASLASALWISVPGFGDNYLGWLAGEWTPQRARASFTQLVHPGRDRSTLETALARQRVDSALPLVREEVGDAPVDFFGLRHGILLLNGLNYRPRPMGGGAFNAYNPYLMELNRAFLADPVRRPAWYLLKFETIDGRLAAQDDGRAFLELVQRYRPVLNEDGYLLLQARTGAAEVAAPTSLATQSFGWGERVTVPAVPPDRLLVARFTVAPSLAGRLRRFLYKLPEVTIRLQTTGHAAELSRRLIPEMAASPFLFSPLVEDNAGCLALFGGQPGELVREFTLVTDAPAAYAAELRVDYFTVPRPAAARAPDAEELRAEFQDGLFRDAPARLEAADTHSLQLGKLRVQPLHAPGRAVWPLDGTEQEFIFGHGLLPDAYTKGHGNGVAFIVELHAPGAAPQVLYGRLVDPFTRPEERRTLTARVPLPPHLAGSELVLRTDPGPGGDNAWDWSYITRVLLRRGFTAGNFQPVFDRVPLALAGPAPAVTSVNHAPAILLHVPGRMELGLRETEHQVHLGFGFLPGAYTGDGRTGGADFVVEWQRPGQAAREIFRRTLRPVDVAADRGPQSATLALPALATGDRLILRTTPAPGGSDSWGWTYFSRCTIE